MASVEAGLQAATYPLLRLRSVRIAGAYPKLAALVVAADGLVIEIERWYKSINPKNLGLSKLKAAIAAEESLGELSSCSSCTRSSSACFSVDAWCLVHGSHRDHELHSPIVVAQ